MERPSFQTLHRGDVYWADLNNICTGNTSIYHKIRPVVIMSNEKCNQYSPILTVIPISSRIHKATHIPTQVRMKLLNKDRVCCTSQPISLPRNQLLEYMDTLTNEDMSKIEDGLRIQLQLA